MSIKKEDKNYLDEYKNNLDLINSAQNQIKTLNRNINFMNFLKSHVNSNKKERDKNISNNQDQIKNLNEYIRRLISKNEEIKNRRNDEEWKRELIAIENKVKLKYARKPTNNKKSKIRSAQNNSRRKSPFKILRFKKIISAIFRSNNSKKREVSDEQLVEKNNEYLNQAQRSIKESETIEEAFSIKTDNSYNIDDDETLIEEEFREIAANNKETKKKKDITLELANRLLSDPDTNMSAERSSSHGDNPSIETQINENVMEKAVITDDEWTAKDIDNLVKAVEWISMVNNNGVENNQNEIETSTNISNDVQANIDTNLNDKPEMEQISNESQVIVGEKTNNNQQKAKPMVDKPQSVNEQEMPVDNRNFRIGNNKFVIPSNFTVEFSQDEDTGVETRTIKNGEQIIGSVASIDNQVISAHFNSVEINMDIGGKTRALSSESELTLNYDFGEKKMTYEATDKDFPEQSFKMDFSDNEIIKPRMEENMTLDTLGYDPGTYGESSYACNSYIEEQKSAYRSNAKAYSR